MSLNGPLLNRAGATWKYALAGGLGSIPLTLAAYWQAGMGGEFTLSAVFLGAALAGYLAGSDVRDATDATAVGVRAGIVGGLPAFAWFASDVAGAASALAGPAWFLAGATVLFFVAVVTVLAVAGIVGYLGGAVGGWLAGKTGRRAPALGN